MPKKKDPKSAWEEALEMEAEKRGVSFEQVARENLDYDRSLVDQGVPGSKESYSFFRNMIESILHRRGSGGEKKG